MKNNKKLLFINPGQFGYHAGYYYYVKYLKEQFQISFLCHNIDLPKVEIEDVGIKYISFDGKKIVRYLRWLKAVYQTIKNTDDNTLAGADL